MNASETPSDEGSVTWYFRQLRDGDETGAAGLVEHFRPRLLALAKKHLGALPRRVFDADGAVQSAFGSFFFRVARGEYDKDLDRLGLWKLLAVITAHKALKQLEREKAQKRGGGNVITETDLTKWLSNHQVSAPLDNLFSKIKVDELDLVCEEMLNELPEDVRPFVLLRLAGQKNKEIAEIMSCSERKVERKIELARKIWRTNLKD